MTSSRAVTRRAALAAFLLFAAALFVVGPADASRTTTDLRTNVASSQLEPSPLELAEPIDAAPRFGFGGDLGLLDPEAGPGGFVVFARETSRCELTYARNNPLKYVDPDGMAIRPAPQFIPLDVRDARQGVDTTLNALEGRGSAMGFAGESRLAIAPLRDLSALLLPLNHEDMLMGAFGLALLVPSDGTGGTLYRWGRKAETLEKLSTQAAKAEKVINIHGVSVSTTESGKVASGAARSEVEKAFKVHNTPTKADAGHKTVELPKPITQAIVDLFNKVFKRAP